jgi:hypothetical protein
MGHSTNSGFIGRTPGNGSSRIDGRIFWAMISQGDPDLSQLAELCRVPYAALQPTRAIVYSLPKAPAAAAGQPMWKRLGGVRHSGFERQHGRMGF